MLLSHLEWLCIILPTLIAATPQTTVRAQSSSLPDKLQRDVPACAQPCLRRSLSEQFPLSCTVPTDLSCLCSRYSFNGDSLGEVCLGCIYASCSTYDRTAASAYNICFGQKNAVVPTKTVLTVSSRSSSSSTMSSSRPVTTTRSRSTVTSPTLSSGPPPTNTVAVNSVSLTSSPTPTIAAVAAQDTTPKMKPAQIAGLSVAAGAAFIIAIGLMALSVFLRRRRERKHPPDLNEKGGISPSPTDNSPRFSYGFNQASSSEPPSRFPMPPVPILQRPDQGSRKPIARVGFPPPKRTNPPVLNRNQSDIGSTSDLSSIHPLFRPGAGTTNNSSSSVPLDQIGLAISAELPGSSSPSQAAKQAMRRASGRLQRVRGSKRESEFSQRPESCVTESTVFEEDDVRRESRLLPLPPFPIPPIRSFQPPRQAPTFDGGRAVGAPTRARQLPQQPELFLDIPVRHSRSQPMPITQQKSPPTVVSKAPSRSAQRTQLAPPIRVSSEYKATTTTTSSPERNNGEDIPDYYFTAHQDPAPKYLTPSISPSRFHKPKDSPKMVSIKPKLSSSTVSRATSRASTNVRDSISSQTSFETADADDPTPEYEDDSKRLSDTKLSPVAESPISNLRYPKVPRASNQLVRRSPKSPQSQRSLDSPRRRSPSHSPAPSALLLKRRGEQGALQLDSPFDSPERAERREHFQKYRQHLRSNSVETWSEARTSERSTRTQSSLWPKSPAMYEPNVVRPLNVRSRQNMQPPPVEMEALKSPAWVPRLTPTRHGEDLLISVTYSKPGH